MRRLEILDLAADPIDVIEIETQYDDARGTVLYIHINGVTALRIHHLSKESQLVGDNPIIMEGRYASR